MSKRIAVVPALVAGLLIATVTALLVHNAHALADEGSRGNIVGAWHVDAIGAPFQPHQFTFTQDGSVFTTNPTNVQESAIPGHPGGVNDSVGMGSWQQDGGAVALTFYQLNADATTHAPAE